MDHPPFQHLTFTYVDLNGRKIEQLLGFTNEEGAPIVLFLKVEGHLWQRFYIDAGLHFWNEVSDADARDELSQDPYVDFGERLGVVGQTVGIIVAEGTPELYIALTKGGLILDETGLRLDPG